jgi:hypothetical protein
MGRFALVLFNLHGFFLEPLRYPRLRLLTALCVLSAQPHPWCLVLVLLKKHKAGTCGKAAYFICNLPDAEAAKMIEILKPNKKSSAWRSFSVLLKS